MENSRRRAFAALALLTLVNALNFFDRQILASVSEPIRREWGLSDAQTGWLGTAFILLYAIAGWPLGRLADIKPRKWILAFGLLAWSVLTTLSGLSRGFWDFFVLRLGIGIGEAACAPTSTSLIGDIFGPHERGRALSVFMMGLPLGISLSYLVGGALAQHFGWRAAYLMSGIPGILVSLAVLNISEPPRGAIEKTPVGASRRPGSALKVVLGIPTMWWLMASGAVHNFVLYSISYFLPTFLIRYHGTTIWSAGFLSAAVIGCVGGAGMLLGGWAGDLVRRRMENGRLLITAGCLVLAVPALWWAFRREPGDLVPFLASLGIAWLLLYVYYSNVYSTIHDVIEPSLRGTGMSLYLLAAYAMGAFMGPAATGWASDACAREAALRAGIKISGSAIPEVFRSAGLRRALGLTPAPCILLALAVIGACVTVGRDVARLALWADGARPRKDNSRGAVF